MLGFAAAGALGVATAAIPGPANNAHAGEAQAATPAANSGLMMRQLRHYSEDADTKGIGVFINFQANAPVTGEQIAHWLRGQLVDGQTAIPFKYRTNQSHGTTTDFTFYVRGDHLTLNIEDLQADIHKVLDHHRGIWLPETASLSKPTITQ